MSNRQVSSPPSPRLPFHTVLLCGAGGSIALHLGVFAISPLWLDSMNRPLAGDPVELLMLETTANATTLASELVSEPATTTLNTDRSDTHPIDTTPSTPLTPIATTTNYPAPALPPQPTPSPLPDRKLDDPDTSESSDNPPPSNAPDKDKLKDIQGIRREHGEAGSSDAGAGTGESGDVGDQGGEGRGGARRQGMVVGSRRSHGSPTGRDRGLGAGQGAGAGSGDRSSGGRGTSVGSQSRGGATPRSSTQSSGDIACTGSCHGRYQGSRTEVIERDPLIRAYRNARGELEFELIQSSGSAEADRAALATAQQASYTSDRAEFTIRARIMEEDSASSPPVRDSTPIPVTPPLEPDPISPSEPVLEEPVYEEPAVEEPMVTEPAYEEPIMETPVYEEPVYEEPIMETPVYEEPVYEEPIIEAPVYDEPVIEEPAVEESSDSETF